MHNFSGTKFREICRYTGAVLLLLAPVFACPLNLLHLVKKIIPYWHLAEAVTPEAMTCLALGIVVSEPERLKKFFLRSPLIRFFLLLLAGLLLLIPVRLAVYGGTWEFALQEGFYPLVIAAGIVLSKEIRRILIPVLSFWGIIAVFFTLKELAGGGRWWTGFCGNWNWNFALLAAVLPAGLFWFTKLKKICFAIGLSLLFPLLAGIFAPELFPRGAMLGIAGGAIYLLSYRKLQRIPLKNQIAFAVILFGIGITFLYSTAITLANDCRIHLWRSAWNVFLDAPLTGTGARIASFLTNHLPPEYFSCSNLAEFHPHAHNELFQQMAYSGIFGLLLLPCALLLMLQRRHRTPLFEFIDYTLIILLIHGCFDVTLMTKTPGMLFWVLLGTAAAGNYCTPKTNTMPKFYPAVWLAGFGAFALVTILCWQSSVFFRNSKILLDQNNAGKALEEINAGTKLPFFPITGHYLGARINLFGQQNNQEALRHLDILSAIGMPDIERSNELRGLILENLNRPDEAVNAHLRELMIFPFNLRSAVLAADLARRGNMPEKSALQHHLNQVLAARNLTVADLQRPLDCDKINLEPVKLEHLDESCDALIRRQMGNAFYSIAMTLLCLAAIYGMGVLLLKTHANDSAALTLAAGLPVFSIAALSIQFLPRLFQIIILLVFAFFGIRAMVKFIKKIPPLVSTLVFILTLYLLGSALLPPFGWDEQIYQIALPFHQSGVIADNPYSAYPALLRWVNQMGCLIGGLNFPRLAIIMLWGLLLLDSFKLFRQKCPAYIAVCGLLLLSWSSLSVIVIREANSEIWQMIFVLGAAHLLLNFPTDSPRRTRLLGWCIAGVLSVKFTGIIPASAIFLLTVVNRNWRKNLLWCLVAALPVIIIFTLPGLITLHNPCYPYLAKIFGTSIEVEKFHHALAYDRFGNHGVLGFFTNWLLPVIYPEKFDGVAYSPALPMLVISGIWCLINGCRKKQKNSIILLAAVLLAYTMWFLCGSQTRFILPCLSVIILLAAILLKKYYPKLLIPVFSLAILLVLCNMSIPAMHPHYKHFPAAWKKLSAARRNPMKFLKRAAGDQDYFRTVQFCQSLPESSKLLLLSEKRTLYLPKFCAIGDVPFQNQNLYPVPENETEFLQKIKRFTHLYMGNAKAEIDAHNSALPNREKMQDMVLNLIKKGVLKVKFATSSTLVAEIPSLPDNNPAAATAQMPAEKEEK